MYIIRQGEPLVLALDVESGDIDSVTSLTAPLKRVGTNNTIPPLTAPVLLNLTVRKRNPGETDKEGWDLTLTPTQTYQLGRGRYVTSATLNIRDVGPLKTDVMFIEIIQSLV